MNNTCTVTQLIDALNKLAVKHGDLPVHAADADTPWRLPIGIAYMVAEEGENMVERIEITTDYYSEPRGFIAPNNEVKGA